MSHKGGRQRFDCATCPDWVKKKRRCEEDREDFTDKDDPATFPIYVSKGGNLYNFCPAKATWDVEYSSIYRLLMISMETGVMINNGGLRDQPAWFIELLGWFIPTYDQIKFSSRCRQVLGDGEKLNKVAPKGNLAHGNNNRRFSNPGNSRQ